MKIPFVKYSTYGNNFVIVDETEKQIIPESQLSNCAVQVTNSFFSVGADSLILIQKFDRNNIEKINHHKNYWKTIPDFLNPDYTFRMFEPDGTESLNCGNGLLALSNFIYHKNQKSRVEILTEIPSATPLIRTLGTNEKEKIQWANIGSPKRVDDCLVRPDIRKPATIFIDELENIKIDFKYDEFNFLPSSGIYISGYLLSTGEPHFVIFTDDLFAEKSKADMIFKPLDLKANMDLGLWFVNHVGSYLNQQCSDCFPEGINVNFVKIVDKKKGIINYRCFERGINRETMACGTGATAVAALCLSLGLISTGTVTLLPYRCRHYRPNAEIRVEKKGDEFILHGYPSLLCMGEFIFDPDKSLKY